MTCCYQHRHLQQLSTYFRFESKGTSQKRSLSCEMAHSNNICSTPSLLPSAKSNPSVWANWVTCVAGRMVPSRQTAEHFTASREDLQSSNCYSLAIKIMNFKPAVPFSQILPVKKQISRLHRNSKKTIFISKPADFAPSSIGGEYFLIMFDNCAPNITSVQS